MVSKHNQPQDTARVISKIRELPRRVSVQEVGFDAVGITVVKCSNAGTRVELVDGPPAPQPADIDYYDNMIRRVAQLYEARFGLI